MPRGWMLSIAAENAQEYALLSTMMPWHSSWACSLADISEGRRRQESSSRKSAAIFSGESLNLKPHLSSQKFLRLGTALIFTQFL